MNRVSRKYPGAAIAAGAIAGLVAAWFQRGWDDTWPPLAIGRISESMIALVTVFTHAPAPAWAAFVMLLAFSILCGAAYGILVEFFPVVALGAGAVFGVLIWVGAHDIIMPLMRLARPPWDLPLNQQAYEVVGHALWGLVIGVFFWYFRSRVVKPVALSTVNQPMRIPVAESVAVY
jgi:putative membrane protein